MRRRTQCIVALAMLVICGLVQSAAAYYSPRQGRFISRDPIGEQGGLNLYCYTRNSPPARYDPLGQSDQPNPGPSGGSWSRRLDKGPFGLDGKDPGYRIDILHIVPPVPVGSTQLWQVFKCVLTKMDDNCMLDFSSRVITDVVDIGDRKEIPDMLRLRYTLDAEKHTCFALELCTAIVGFDNGNPRPEDPNSDDDLPAFVDGLLQDMRSPSTYGTAYVFLKKKNCCPCVRNLLEWANVADGEHLTVGGVGSWHSP